MPVLAFLAVAGFALIALLFVAEATLEPGSPVIVTSNRIGLPEPRHPDTIQNSHHRTSTRARHDVAGGTCCSAQVGTCSSGEDKARSAQRGPRRANGRLGRQIFY